jgi:hypothetical protein
VLSSLLASIRVVTHARRCVRPHADRAVPSLPAWRVRSYFVCAIRRVRALPQVEDAVARSMKRGVGASVVSLLAPSVRRRLARFRTGPRVAGAPRGRVTSSRAFVMVGSRGWSS